MTPSAPFSKKNVENPMGYSCPIVGLVSIIFKVSFCCKRPELQAFIKTIEPFLKKLKSDIPVMAKIEHPLAIDNLDKIISCSGNAQGYQLSLENYTNTVPVSRSKLKAFNMLFENS